MPFDIANIGMNAANQAANGILGIALGAYNDQRQLRQQEKLQNLQMKGQKELSQFQLQQQLALFNKTGFQAQKRQIQEAGLNPALLYGMGGAAGGQTGTQTPGLQGANAPAGGREIQDLIGMAIQQRAQTELLQAQKENIEADTANKLKTLPNIEKTGLNIDADTANKKMQEIILKYGGKEAERQWNINKELSTEEYGAKADEFEARKAAAAQLVKLYEDGTMQKMTQADLDKKIQDLKLGNLLVTKTELENAILELEKNMQATLGIDKNAPAWLRIIGRLVMGFLK